MYTTTMLTKGGRVHCLSLVQQSARNDDALYLAGSLIDCSDPYVSRHAFQWVIPRIASAAHQLQSTVAGVVGFLRSEQLCHRRCIAEVLARILLPGRVQQQQARRLQFCAGLGYLPLDPLEIGYRLVELLPLADVIPRDINRRLRDTEGKRADADPPASELAYRLMPQPQRND